ncbi:MAG: hypothetical protein AB7N76_22100 [Planctomycetota bacterium]
MGRLGCASLVLVAAALAPALVLVARADLDGIAVLLPTLLAFAGGMTVVAWLAHTLDEVLQPRLARADARRLLATLAPAAEDTTWHDGGRTLEVARAHDGVAARVRVARGPDGNRYMPFGADVTVSVDAAGKVDDLSVSVHGARVSVLPTGALPDGPRLLALARLLELGAEEVTVGPRVSARWLMPSRWIGGPRCDAAFFAEATRLLAEVGAGAPRPVDVPGAPRLVPVTPDPGLRCVYCHDGFEALGAVACADCGASYHAPCVEESGACATFGCASRRGATRGRA